MRTRHGFYPDVYIYGQDLLQWIRQECLKSRVILPSRKRRVAIAGITDGSVIKYKLDTEVLNF